MSYESDCADYAIHGDPERDHWDYEENAGYDRYDGWGDPDPCDDPDGRIDEPPPADCNDYLGYENLPMARLMQIRDEASDCEDWRTCDEIDAELCRRDRENDPDSPDYVPF
jgi:hypothetical protein